MEQGATEASIIKQNLQAGTPIPDVIVNKPELTQGLEVFYDAFYELDSERLSAMSVGKIPFRAVQAYADEFQFEGEQREDLFYFVRQIDNAVIKKLNEKARLKSQASNGKSTGVSRPAR